MKDEIRTEILYDLAETIAIMSAKKAGDLERLKTLSDHAIEDVAVQKDLDIISITVLIYSLYKIVNTMKEADYQRVVQQLRQARDYLQQRELGKYNFSVKQLFSLVRKLDAKVQVHLHDVMHAARIRKGTTLLQKGLSIGQAAGLMGLSNWDLQQYAAKTTALEHEELLPAKVRLQRALKIFEV